jgi:aminocarboxymuconate-semialdehyde decarboxylase
MFFTCAPGCLDPAHAHIATARSAAARMSRPAPLTKVPRRKGGSARIDIHCHYFNPEVGASVASLNPGQYEPSVQFANAITRETNVAQMRDRSPQLSDIEVRLRDMDRMGIDIQAVSPAPFQYYYWTEPGHGAELATRVNDRIAEIAATHPDRFVGLGTVPLQNADLAVKELERAMGSLGLRGVEICTNVNGLNLTDPSLKLEKFFARAQELGAVIFMHPNGFTHAERLTEHYLNNVIGNPLESTVAVSSLIFDGVIERNPKLKIVVAHAGGYLAHYWARMDHAWRARPDSRTKIRRKPSSYLKKFHFDTITFDPDMLRHLITTWGADKVLLGTDYPYDMGEVDPLGLIAQVKRLPREEREAIEGGNAARLLRIRKAPSRNKA